MEISFIEYEVFSFFSLWEKRVMLHMCFLWLFWSCIPNSVRQEYLDEELWKKTSRRADIDYYFTEVTATNFQEVFVDSEELFYP